MYWCHGLFLENIYEALRCIEIVGTAASPQEEPDIQLFLRLRVLVQKDRLAIRRYFGDDIIVKMFLIRTPSFR